MRSQTDSFTAVADDGRAFIVNEYRETVPAGNMRDPHATIPARLATYETTEGHTVSPNQDGTFEIIQFGLTVRPVTA